ncbi:MAG: hypothetical protein V4596_12495 [Bdellovibrionota bacterium]
MYNEFIEFCKLTYPEFKEVFEKESPSPNLFSFQTVTMPQETFEKIKEFVQVAYHLRNNASYQKDILGQAPVHPNLSVLMSFDFHIVNGNPKLIEINTNASHFLTSKLMEDFVCKTENRKSAFPNAIEKLKDSFLNEWKLFSNQMLKTISIVDEDPTMQRAYFEFLLYKKMFEQMGLSVSIDDAKELAWNSKELINSKKERVDFVYNRSTDFYFEESISQALQTAYESNASCISPQPQEYQLLADKKRLLDFGTAGFLEKYLSTDEIKLFRSIVLEIVEVKKEDKEKLWSDRKKYFFKPKNSYGGKGAYKGESITHKTFDQVLEAGDYIAQEFAPPSTTPITDQVSHKVDAKYDLRFFVYNGEIQHAAVRTYIGQTTNFRTLGGGFAALFIE